MVHLELRRRPDLPCAELLWGDLRVLRAHGDLKQTFIASPGELALVPVQGRAISACLATLPTVLGGAHACTGAMFSGCPVPAVGVQVAFPAELSATRSSIWVVHHV